MSRDQQSIQDILNAAQDILSFTASMGQKKGKFCIELRQHPIPITPQPMTLSTNSINTKTLQGR